MTIDVSSSLVTAVREGECKTVGHITINPEQGDDFILHGISMMHASDADQRNIRSTCDSYSVERFEVELLCFSGL